MNHHKRVLIILSLLLFHVHVEAQSLGADSDDAVTNFQPSLAVVIGILSIMFSLTFLLLLYAKFCHRRGSVLRSNHQNLDVITRSASGLSGIDKSVIKSLPFFRFSALRGSRGGLECAVCLSRFEDVEVLRLLPKCKHAFHIDCVDRWLEKHSSCPLCRHKVSADDVAIFASSDSLRFLMNQTELREDSNIELFVQREEDRYGSSRFSVGSSFRRIDKGLEDRDREDEDDRKVLTDKFEHEIVLSDVVFRNRWSNVSSSDLMLLNSEMISDMSNNRFTQLGSKRSMSDITAISRFGDHRNMIGEASSASSDNVMRKQWLPIAKRTVEWFADREKNSTQETNTLHV